MTVGTDILNRCGAGKTGYFTHGFDAGETTFAGVSNNVIPVLAAHDFNHGTTIVGGGFGNPAHAVDDDGALEAFVVAESISPVAHDKSGKMVLLCKTVGVGNFGRLLDF